MAVACLARSKFLLGLSGIVQLGAGTLQHDATELHAGSSARLLHVTFVKFVNHQSSSGAALHSSSRSSGLTLPQINSGALVFLDIAQTVPTVPEPASVDGHGDVCTSLKCGFWHCVYPMRWKSSLALDASWLSPIFQSDAKHIPH